jgi:hypothetical protein
MVQPENYPDLLRHAKSFASNNPKARFALLRIWSSPYFWPLMLGYDNRVNTAFIDGKGRCWDWKYVPKDMQCSEWSIHYSIYSMLNKFKKQLNYDEKGKEGLVVHMRDVILVKGVDEANLMRRVIATTFVVQNRPWLREIDLVMSFINVDEIFLDGLNKWWFE